MVQSLLDQYDIYRFMPMHEYNPVYFYDIYGIRLNADDLAFMTSMLNSFEQRRRQIETLIFEICNYMADTPTPTGDGVPDEISARINHLDACMSLAQREYANTVLSGH